VQPVSGMARSASAAIERLHPRRSDLVMVG
jgi:hypothetical protein